MTTRPALYCCCLSECHGNNTVYRYSLFPVLPVIFNTFCELTGVVSRIWSQTWTHFFSFLFSFSKSKFCKCYRLKADNFIILQFFNVDWLSILGPHQSVQICACSSSGSLFRTVGAERPPVSCWWLLGRSFGASRSWSGVSTSLEHLRWQSEINNLLFFPSFTLYGI